MGLIQRVTAISARIGTRTFAVAVFEAMFVIVTVMKQMMKLTNQIGKLSSSSLLSCETRRVESPDFWDASANANPPPISKVENGFLERFKINRLNFIYESINPITL